MRPIFVPMQEQATLQILAQQVRQIAEVAALTSGEEQVPTEQQDELWVVTVEIPDREPVERHGASLGSYSQWVAEQVRQVCLPKGMVCSVWLEREIQSCDVY